MPLLISHDGVNSTLSLGRSTAYLGRCSLAVFTSFAGINILLLFSGAVFSFFHFFISLFCVISIDEGATSVV